MEAARKTRVVHIQSITFIVNFCDNPNGMGMDVSSARTRLEESLRSPLTPFPSAFLHIFLQRFQKWWLNDYGGSSVSPTGTTLQVRLRAADPSNLIIT
jgi:hypothetical protein